MPTRVVVVGALCVLGVAHEFALLEHWTGVEWNAGAPNDAGSKVVSPGQRRESGVRSILEVALVPRLNDGKRHGRCGSGELDRRNAAQRGKRTCKVVCLTEMHKLHQARRIVFMVLRPRHAQQASDIGSKAGVAQHTFSKE